MKPLAKCWKHLIAYHFLFIIYIKQSRILSSTGYQTLIPRFFFQTSIITVVGICKPVFWTMTTMTFWRKIMNYYSKTIWIWKIKINLHICLDINIYAYTHIYKITYLRILKAGTYKTNLIHTFIERVCLSYPNLCPHIKQTHRNIYYLHVLKIKKWNFYFR